MLIPTPETVRGDSTIVGAPGRTSSIQKNLHTHTRRHTSYPKHHAHSLSTFHTHTLAHTARNHTHATPVRTHTRNQPNRTAQPALMQRRRIHTDRFAFKIFILHTRRHRAKHHIHHTPYTHTHWHTHTAPEATRMQHPPAPGSGLTEQPNWHCSMRWERRGHAIRERDYMAALFCIHVCA